MTWMVQFEERNLSAKSGCCCGVGVTHTSTAGFVAQPGSLG